MTYNLSSRKGITLIELMIALVIGGIVTAGIYRLFIAQSKAYTVQDQVIEVQQSIRGAMEVMMRDLRRAGYNGTLTPNRLLNGIFPGNNSFTVANDAVRVEYRSSGLLNTKVIYRNAGTSELMEDFFVDGVQQAGYPIVLLENVNALAFAYGVDGREGLEETQDGAIDDTNGDNVINGDDFVSAADVAGGNLHVIAVRVALTASPTPVNPDIPVMVKPRTLVSSTIIRNLCLLKTK